MTESFAIQSDINNLTQVEERLFHFCRECNVGSYFSTISVAAMQAVRNAIVHGNAGDADKRVTLSFGTCRGGVYVQVSDEGRGFDYASYGDLPADGQSVGEGIFVMRSLADELRFADGGRTVRLMFAVDGIDPTYALERASVLRQHFEMVAA